MAETTSTRDRSLIAAAVAAVGASICCAGPFVLLMLGVSGAWIGNLTASVGSATASGSAASSA